MLFRKTLAFSLALLLPSICLAGKPAVQSSEVEQAFNESMEKADAPYKPALTMGSDKLVMKDWTIMVFINGKNNLEKFAYMDVNEMEMVGSSEDKNVVVELGVPAGSTRMLITKDSDTKVITSPAVVTMPQADMGDYNHLADFIKWAKTTYPAKHYMLTVWNHGSGWVKGSRSKGISYDDETNNHISVPQLAKALAATGGVDIYTSDACLMQMAEVVAEIAPYAKYVVGSEETEGGDGYTYNTMLEGMPSDPKEVALHTAKKANEFYSRDSTQSVIDTSKMKKFPQMMDKWVSTVMANVSSTTVKSLMRQTQSYAYADNKDLVDFVTKVNANMTGVIEDELKALREPAKDEQPNLIDQAKTALEIMKKQAQLNAMKKAGEKLVSYITEELVVGNFTSDNMKKSHGVAIYIPNYGMDKNYGDMQWSQNTQWDEFIGWMNKR